MKFTVRETPNPTRKGDTTENTYGFKTVEIVQFNYDGKGGAIVVIDGNELGYLDVNQLENIIDGKWYYNDVDNDSYVIESGELTN
jgi:hypothetical protein